MALKHIGYIDLPSHVAPGGFDHAAVHSGRGLLYVAHTGNDAIDVIDCATNTYLRAIPDLTGVAGALVSDAHDLVFTSNRGENTVGIFSTGDRSRVDKIEVGVRPNGLAYDRQRARLLVAETHQEDPTTRLEDRRQSFNVAPPVIVREDME